MHSMNRINPQKHPILRIKSNPHVHSISDERASGDGIWVYLRNGFNNGDGGEHAIHEDTFAACAEKLSLITPCNCKDCTHL